MNTNNIKPIQDPMTVKDPSSDTSDHEFVHRTFFTDVASVATNVLLS